MALSLPTRITLHFCTTFATLLLHFRPGALRMTVRSCRQKKPLVLPHDYPFVPPSFSALRRRVRLRSAGEPDNRVRTFSTRYLTANSHWPHTSRPIWPLFATAFVSAARLLRNTPLRTPGYGPRRPVVSVSRF